MARKPFEQSRWDDDRGVKENSPADKKRDAKEKRAMRKAETKQRGKGRGRGR